MQRVIELQGIVNVRDLGGIAAGPNRVVKPGLLFRGSALMGITEADRRILGETLGIRCVIDVRCGWEREAKPDEPIPGAEYLHIPFYDLEKVGIEYTEPAEGTKVVGRDVACNPDRFYRSLANPLTVGQMRAALHEALDHALGSRPVYLHCSGGKDRAGIMSLLVLNVLGASRDDILADYLLTNVSRDREYERTFQRFLRFASGDEALAHELTHSHRARPENLEAFYEAVGERYGSMEAFMRDQLDVNDDYRKHARGKLTAPTVE